MTDRIKDAVDDIIAEAKFKAMLKKRECRDEPPVLTEHSNIRPAADREKKCSHCGGIYQKRTKDTWDRWDKREFCSWKCSNTAKRTYPYGKNKKKCEGCGKKFEKPYWESWVKWETRRFCSRACVNKLSATFAVLKNAKITWEFVNNIEQEMRRRGITRVQGADTIPFWREFCGQAGIHKGTFASILHRLRMNDGVTTTSQSIHDRITKWIKNGTLST